MEPSTANIRLLRDYMLLWGTGVLARKFVFVQYNAMPHTTRDTTAFRAQYDADFMDIPDLNHNEHDWDQMGVWI